MNPLPDYQQALDQALSGVAMLERLEQVELADASGRALAETIVADRDLPPFNRAQMDGYALRASELGTVQAWPVAQRISAGSSPAEVHVPPGQCVAIATGAPLPAELDTVVQHELSNRGDRLGNPVTFTVNTIARGHAVHPRGADAHAGAVLIAKGTLLGAHHLGIAAAVGSMQLSVRARPRAVVLTSGDEVVSPATPLTQLRAHQIRNSNGPMIGDLLGRFGARTIAQMHIEDDRQRTIAALRSALADADLIITIGGVSAGERDHFPAAFEACGVRPRVRGASIQPGKPICIGHAAGQAQVIALPGNPVSALACACLFIWPIVLAMLGAEAKLPWRTVELSESVKPNPNRRAFRPSILDAGGKATVPSWAGSGDLAHTSGTHGLLELPIQQEPVAAGTALRFLPWP